MKFADEYLPDILSGKKRCTIRTEKKGEIGDTFEVAGHTFRITDIYEGPAVDVCVVCYSLEGCSTPPGCYVQLKKHYPNLQHLDHVYAHLFTEVVR